MSESITARRYARAIFEIALVKGDFDRWRSDIEVILSAFNDPDLARILDNPRIIFEKKTALIKRCVPGVSQRALNVGYLLVSKRRAKTLPQIATEFERLVDRHRGLVRAEVTTATAVDSKTKDSIAKYLAELTGRRIELSEKVDPEIIGGFLARVEDRLIDGSVRSRLESLKEKLVRG